MISHIYALSYFDTISTIWSECGGIFIIFIYFPILFEHVYACIAVNYGLEEKS